MRERKPVDLPTLEIELDAREVLYPNIYHAYDITKWGPNKYPYGLSFPTALLGPVLRGELFSSRPHTVARSVAQPEVKAGKDDRYLPLLVQKLAEMDAKNEPRDTLFMENACTIGVGLVPCRIPDNHPCVVSGRGKASFTTLRLLWIRLDTMDEWPGAGRCSASGPQ